MKIKSLLMCLGLVFLTSCGGNNDGKLKFATTFAPVYDIVRSLTKDLDVEINCLVGKNEPHDFSPSSAQDIAFIEKCDVFFAYGRNIDSHMKSLNEEKYYEITENLKPIIVDDIVDPHDWLSPKRYKLLAENVKNKLIEVDAKNEKIYEHNFNDLDFVLTELNRDYENYLSEEMLKSNILVAGHDCFGYLAADYGLVQKSIKDIGNHEASTSQLDEIIQYIKENNVEVIFGEEFDENETINAVIDELKVQGYGCSVAYLNSYERIDVSKTDNTYNDIMSKNLEVLIENLGK